MKADDYADQAGWRYIVTGMNIYRLVAISAASMAVTAFPAVEASPVTDDWSRPPSKYRRGKRVQAKPKKRRNMLTVSKRARRKHRRAA